MAEGEFVRSIADPIPLARRDYLVFKISFFHPLLKNKMVCPVYVVRNSVLHMMLLKRLEYDISEEDAQKHYYQMMFRIVLNYMKIAAVRVDFTNIRRSKKILHNMRHENFLSFEEALWKEACSYVPPSKAETYQYEELKNLTFNTNIPANTPYEQLPDENDPNTMRDVIFHRPAISAKLDFYE